MSLGLHEEHLERNNLLVLKQLEVALIDAQSYRVSDAKRLRGRWFLILRKATSFG